MAQIKKTPKVSWLICAHKLNDHLKEALVSCLSQDFEDFECVFVANGDQAQEIAKAVRKWFGHDDRLRIFETEIKHLNFSLTLGLHQALGELVARMDSDDISSSRRLSLQVEYMNNNPKTVVLGTDYEIINNEGKRIKSVNTPKKNKCIRNELIFRNPICHPSVIYRRNAIIKAGGYIGGLYAEDYDLWLRLANESEIIFENLPNICLSYREQGVGEARGARLAYASVSAAQYRNFVAGHGLKWAIAALITAAKGVMLGRK